MRRRHTRKERHDLEVLNKALDQEYETIRKAYERVGELQVMQRVIHKEADRRWKQEST